VNPSIASPGSSNQRDPDHSPGIERAFTHAFEEADNVRCEVEGEIPSFVRGTLLMNGPARFGRGDVRYKHWLDGDGMVAALRFGEGGASYQSRFVKSSKLAREEKEGRVVYRAFGTSFSGDELIRGIALASPVNVSAYPVAGKLLAFGEQGLPWALDRATLETEGEHSFDGQLNAISPFSAHPKFDRVTGEMFNFGISYSATAPILNVYRFGADQRLVYRSRIPIGIPSSVHDFSIGPRHLVFHLSPYLLDMSLLSREGKSVMEALSWEPARGSRLVVVARDSGELVASIPAGSSYCLHLINAFGEDGRLVVDLLELDRPVYDQYQTIPDLFTDVSEGGAVRFVLDLEGARLVSRVDSPYRSAPDFPTIDLNLSTRRADEFWMVGISATGKPGRKFFDEMVHGDWSAPAKLDVYRAPGSCYFGSEPVHVADPVKKHPGVVIAHMFDATAMKSSWLLFDASSVSKGPVARVRVPTLCHLGFHTCFERETVPQ